MKRNYIGKLASLVLILAVLFAYQSVAKAREAQVAQNQAEIAEIDAYNRELLRQQGGGSASYEPGTYTGEGQGFGGAITVSVTVSETEIEAIEVLTHAGEDPAYFSTAESVVDAVLRAQGTDVDTASGATFSSLGLLDAINAALEEAVKG